MEYTPIPNGTKVQITATKEQLSREGIIYSLEHGDTTSISDYSHFDIDGHNYIIEKMLFCVPESFFKIILTNST